MSARTYGRFDEGSREAIAEMLGRSFGFPPAETGPWIDRLGASNVRVLREGDSPAACLLRIPMGQWLGGRSVRMEGVAGVAVPLERRGRGVGVELMSRLVRELAAEGVPLSTLYPATQTLYRKVGYELAGGRYEIAAPASALALGDRSVPLRPMTPADRPEVERIYAAWASSRPGYLDRGEYVWSRVASPRGETAYGYVAGRAGALEGYLFLTQRRRPDGRHDVHLTDVAAVSARAARSILTFLGDQRSVAVDVTWHGGPAEPLLALVGEPSFGVRLGHYWMTRITHVAGALEARGYGAGLGAELALHVKDELCAENGGAFTLRVEGRQGTVRRGGEGGLRLTVRALAPLYTGHASASALRALGWLEGDDDAVAIADALFAGPAPATADFF
jgi:predicted acetyltransferase